jgi:2-oxoisovalerate dehydrogenase E1 component alpha subunit
MAVKQEAQSVLSKEISLEMYWTMLLARRLDERAWVLHRQGKIAFHISGIGHEAAQVGAAFALRRGSDWFVPYYRDLAMLLALGMTPTEFMLGLLGKKDEPNSGARQMPSHWSLRRANVVSHSSPVSTQTTHAAGIGLAMKLRGDDGVALTSVGEGGTSQGEWYEGVNWAAVHKLPVIFFVENNSYAISVRQELQMGVSSVADKAAGLGLAGVSVDGLDVHEVYRVVGEAAERARDGQGPTLVEARVNRMTPHSSDDDDRTYRSKEELDALKKDDPLIRTRDKLTSDGLLDKEQADSLEERAKQAVEEAAQAAEKAPYPSDEEATYPVYVEDVRHG